MLEIIGDQLKWDCWLERDLDGAVFKQLNLRCLAFFGSSTWRETLPERCEWCVSGTEWCTSQQWLGVELSPAHSCRNQTLNEFRMTSANSQLKGKKKTQSPEDPELSAAQQVGRWFEQGSCAWPLVECYGTGIAVRIVVKWRENICLSIL